MSEDQLSEYQRHLVSSHIGLAQNVANSFWRKAQGALDREELISVAYQGLMTAAFRFDPDLRPGDDPNYDPSLGFGAFARTRISGAIQDWLRSRDHLPKRQRRTYKEMQLLNPGSSPEEVSQALGISVDHVRTIIHAVQNPPVSLDETHDNFREQAYSMPSDDDTESSALASIIQERVAQAFSELSDLQKSVIALKYYIGLDFEQISEATGASKYSVKLAHQEAVLVLHEVMVGAAS